MNIKFFKFFIPLLPLLILCGRQAEGGAQVLPALAAVKPLKVKLPPSFYRAMARCPRRLSDKDLENRDLYKRCIISRKLKELIEVHFTNEEFARPDFSRLELFKNSLTRAQFRYQLTNFADEKGEVLKYIKLAPDALHTDRASGPRISFRKGAGTGPLKRTRRGAKLQPPPNPGAPYRPERRQELLETVTKKLPLRGVRIALDPGHIGGKWSEFEWRHNVWRKNPTRKTIIIREGELTLRTAKELRRKLEALGATVYMTRTEAGTGNPYRLRDFKKYGDNLARNALADPKLGGLLLGLKKSTRERALSCLRLYAMRKQFLFEAIRYRVKKVAAFKPDFMISIHYNNGARGIGKRLNQKILAMIKGNVAPERLYNDYWRFRLLRDSFAVGEFNASAHLGKHLLNNMSKTLVIPIQRKNNYKDHQPVLDKNGRESGVAAWNGILFRYVDWPTALTEGSYMDEAREMIRLDRSMRKPIYTRGARTERYAEGLKRGAVSFVRTWLSNSKNAFGPL